MTKRKRIGDVFEVKTSKGLVYLQYTHEYTKPPNWGSLIRILQGFYKTRPNHDQFFDLINQQHRFQTFCLLQSAIRNGEVCLVGNFPIPEFAQKFPIFKGSNNMPKTDPKEKVWWLWNGEKEWKVGKLSLEEQKKYPIHRLCDITALIKDIESGKSFADELC